MPDTTDKPAKQEETTQPEPCMCSSSSSCPHTKEPETKLKDILQGISKYLKQCWSHLKTMTHTQKVLVILIMIIVCICSMLYGMLLKLELIKFHQMIYEMALSLLRSYYK